MPRSRQLVASSKQYELWLLAATLSTYPDREVPLTDLLRLPELFPFLFHTTVDDLRQSPWFIVQRQAIGIDMVRVNTTPQSAGQMSLLAP